MSWIEDDQSDWGIAQYNTHYSRLHSVPRGKKWGLDRSILTPTPRANRDPSLPSPSHQGLEFVNGIHTSVCLTKPIVLRVGRSTSVSVSSPIFIVCLCLTHIPFSSSSYCPPDIVFPIPPPSVNPTNSTIMAAPESVTIDDLTGVYNLDKTLGDDSSNMLKMQGVGFIIRQAIAYSAVEITLKQTKDAEGITHLDSMQVSTGNQKNDEHWTMNNIETEVDNRIWGKVKGTAKYV